MDAAGVVVAVVAVVVDGSHAQQRNASLLMLSRDTLGIVASHLDGVALYALSLTCTRLRTVCLNRHLWQMLLVKEFGRQLAPGQDAYRVYIRVASRYLPRPAGVENLVLLGEAGAVKEDDD